MTTTRQQRKLFALVGVVALWGIVAPVSAQTTPTSHLEGFDLDTTAYTLRMQGPDRHFTAGSISTVASANSGGLASYPFGNVDLGNPTATLGYGECPAAVALTASDTPADALTASAAYGELVGVPLSTGPGQGDVATFGGSILLTESSRNGVRDLNPAAARALIAIRDECGSIPAAVILGGTSAVSTLAADTLDALVGTVFRFAGADRFDTGRLVARSVNLAGGLPTVAYFTDFDTFGLLPRTVVLAEGLTGADALSIGPLAAELQMPVLLTRSEALPVSTRNALLELAPDNILVLGGPAAVSQVVVDAAAAAAGGATVTRVAGADRYLSSIEIATHLFGIWPEYALDGTAPTGAFSNLPIGFARSEGSGDAHIGWPDALASSWFLAKVNDGAATGAADDIGNPVRFAPPYESQTLPFAALGGETAFLPPLLLGRQSSLGSGVGPYLDSLWPAPTNMITGDNLDPAGTDDDEGGFGYVFGGPAAITRSVEIALAELLSGNTYGPADRSDLAPTQDPTNVFFTTLNFTNYVLTAPFGGGITTTGPSFYKICANRGAYTGTVFQSASELDGDFAGSSALTYSGAGSAWPAGISHAFCEPRLPAGGDDGDDTSAVVFGTSLSGHHTGAKTLTFDNVASVLVTNEAEGGEGEVDAVSSNPANCSVFAAIATATGSCAQAFSAAGPLPITYKGTSHATAMFDLDILVIRSESTAAGNQPDAVAMVGTVVFRSGQTTIVSMDLTGEGAVDGTADNAVLPLAGMYEAGSALGGFHFLLTSAGDLADLAVSGNA